MADVTSRLPAPLSGRSAATSARIFNRGGRAIDYAVAGIPFLSMASPEHPYIIQTADMRKEQQDTEPEPGEQSLSGWWIRSQDSWHGGGGQNFQENRGQLAASIRFFESSGVDVWTENEAKLLRNLLQATATNSEATSLFATTDGNLYLGLNGTVRSTTVGSASATTSIGTITGTATDIAVGKEAWYAVSSNGSVYTKPLVGGSMKSFPLTNADSTFYTDNRLCWAKHRLFATRGRKVYVVDTSLADATPSAAVYSYPTTDWSFTDISEGPAAVYCSGWSETESSILMFTVEDDGGIPTLTAGRTTAIMPRGEKIQRISVIAGTWIGIATSRGFRVGAIDVNGDIQYGPLMLEPDNCVEAKAIAAWDRFFYVSWQTSDSVACVYRVDVSQQPEEDGVFAWARDVEHTSSGYFNDLAVVGDGRVVAAFFAGAYPSQSAAKYWYQHATQLVAEGTITFGKIRFRTTEPKVFKFVTLDIDPLAGSIALDAVLPNDSLNRIGVYNVQGKGEFQQSSLSSDLGPLRSMGLKLTLDRSALDDTAGPVIHSYSIKAIDAVKPQRLIQLPLSCFDKEKWRTGQEDGGDGWAMDRLSALMGVEDGGDIFLYQDFSTGEGRQVKIEQLQFTQEAVPVDVADQNRNSGGLITLVLRTMD